MPFDSNRVECGPGWAHLYEPLIALVEKKGGTVLQVKEKFGGLRFYYGPADDVIERAIRLAEQASAVTCETCAAPGELRGRDWIVTLCQSCWDKREAARAARV
jgi:hypothetical protein